MGIEAPRKPPKDAVAPAPPSPPSMPAELRDLRNKVDQLAEATGHIVGTMCPECRQMVAAIQLDSGEILYEEHGCKDAELSNERVRSKLLSPVPADKPAPTIEQFARELAGQIDSKRESWDSFGQEFKGDAKMRCLARADAMIWVLNLIRHLAAAHGVNIEEGGE